MVFNPKTTKVAYLGISLSQDMINIAIKRHKSFEFRQIKTNTTYKKSLLDLVDQIRRAQNLKFVAAGIVGDMKPYDLGSGLWLQQDIVPLHFKRRGYNAVEEARRAALEARKHFDMNHLPIVTVQSNREVNVSELAQLKSYRRLVPKNVITDLTEQATEFKERNSRLLFINSTPQGGGVALMRHALVRLYRSLGVNASWYVLTTSNGNIFEITKKKFHNVLQSVSPPDIKLEERDIKIYESWIRKNTRKLQKPIKAADVIVIDDPQPSGLIPHIKKMNPKAKIIYRSHIQMETSLFNKKGTAQNITWSYLLQNIKLADVFVSHPIESFIPPNIPHSKVALMPCNTDPLDGLNKPLTDDQIKYYIEKFNEVLVGDHQKPLNLARPYIIQIARFDPSKGILDVVESYRALRRLMAKLQTKTRIPQLVIAGHGALDDPESTPILTEIKNVLSMYRYRSYSNDIKVARLPHSDQMLNALVRASQVVLQLSYKEGCEVKVSEAISKGKPVIAYKTGGIPLQIDNGKTGYLVEPGNSEMVAQHCYELLSDKKLYSNMSKQCIELAKPDFFLIANGTKWLKIANTLMNKGIYRGNMQDV